MDSGLTSTACTCASRPRKTWGSTHDHKTRVILLAYVTTTQWESTASRPRKEQTGFRPCKALSVCDTDVLLLDPLLKYGRFYGKYTIKSMWQRFTVASKYNINREIYRSFPFVDGKGMNIKLTFFRFGASSQVSSLCNLFLASAMADRSRNR